MPGANPTGAGQTGADPLPQRLFHYTLGFLRQTRLRRILQLAGHDLCLGLPGPDDGVVVWGRSPYAARGEAVAQRRKVPLIRIEDAFLRSLRPGRLGDAPIGLMLDRHGVHFDSSTPSDLELILARDPLDDASLLVRARDGIARLQTLDLSKYNLHDGSAAPKPGYVLVIDQTFGDASISHAAASAASFAEMLVLAQTEHPSARIVIKTHPETQSGLRQGHFDQSHAQQGQGRISLCTTPVSPWRLLQGAIAVYTVSSHMGFEAIMAGHRPVVLGQPCYMGWGLTDDRNPLPRRKRRLTRTQLFAAAMILAPIWYDPCRDRLCNLEQAVDQLEAETRALRQDRNGHVATGMRLWKRARLQQVFGQQKPVLFVSDPIRAAETAARTHRSLLVWATKTPATFQSIQIEDGFLRSRGLGANLIPPLSLVTDDLGIYYDPTHESRLEHLIRAPLPPGGQSRTEALTKTVITGRLSKYNLSGTMPNLPPGHRILVAGQVEDDASLRLGTSHTGTNLALLQAARAANPDAILIYKPHPDVESGLRPGALPAPPANNHPVHAALADVVATRADPIALIEACDEIWTMTSLLGFEALLRGKKVTCLGAPFYAGWGLTTDLGPVPSRRLRAADGHPLPRPTLTQLTYATLIAYPRYYDPVSHLPCPPEVAVHRLVTDTIQRPSLALRMLARAQGALASRASLWR